MERMKDYRKQVRAELEELGNLVTNIPQGETAVIVDMARIISNAITSGRVVFTCGNGGSAADAQHIAGELVGRFRKKVKGYKAFALTTNSSVVTALANDFSYREIFSRQLESMAQEGDVVLILSTSGNSPNVVEAARAARRLGVIPLAFGGGGGGRLAEEAELSMIVPHEDFARIQEVHMTFGHILCGLVEEMVLESAT
jgi:D-sedoheptulose 7-phosphate isomerase